MTSRMKSRMSIRTSATEDSEALAQLRLQQLVSSALPVGAFAYSQGIEWAVETGWVVDEDSLRDWLQDLLLTSQAYLEVPLLRRLVQAAQADDIQALEHWCRYLLASRETRELREEERNRGRAMAALLPVLGIPADDSRLACLRDCQLAGFALAVAHWAIPLDAAARAYLWSWLENMVLAGIKIIPLGQTAGQRLIAELSGLIPDCVSRGLVLEDSELGAACLAQAIASSQHETQYTRIYRS